MSRRGIIVIVHGIGKVIDLLLSLSDLQDNDLVLSFQATFTSHQYSAVDVARVIRKVPKILFWMHE